MKISIPNNYLRCREIIHVNDKGININSNEKNIIPYVHPHCLYHNIKEYWKLSPAKLYSAPFIDTYKSVTDKGT